jgi:hypothetical protein
MLFFELFPLFVMLLSLVVGVWLYAANSAARREAEAAEDAGTIPRRDR